MEAQERIELDSMPEKTSDGRDELNLAEFPLCTLAHRLHPGQKTIRFEDRIWDDQRAMTITRQLTITGSDAYRPKPARGQQRRENPVVQLPELFRVHSSRHSKVRWQFGGCQRLGLIRERLEK